MSLAFIWLPGFAVALLFAILLNRLIVSSRAPGPILAKITGFWYVYHLLRGDFEKTNRELHQKHGKVVCLRPNEYSIDDPDAVKIIYGIGSHFRKAKWYSVWTSPDMVSVNLFSLRDSQRHAFVKRQYANLYAMSSLVSYEPSVEDCIALFSRRLSGFCREGKPVDLGRWLQFYAFDVIGAITFSKRFGFMEHGRDVGDIISTIDYTFFNTTIGGYFLWALPLLFALTPKSGTKALTQFTSAAIQERVQTTEKELSEDGPQDFMDKLFKVADKNPQENRLSLITGAAAANIGAGSDTTGITLTAILFNILQNPGVLQKLRDELDTALATGQISDPITFTESQGLPYLQAVFKESMRMHPATGLPMWRVVPPEGVVLCDRYFPGGAVVGTNTWVAHYNCDVYGKDVEDFRPERWIDSDKETLDSMNRYFMPFGLGARTCIGKNISLLEIGKLVPQLVQKFDFQLLDSSKPRLESRNVWFVKQHGFNVLVTERKDAQGK